MELRKAKRSQARLKIGMTGASGSGKTLSSLLLGYGQIKAEHPELSDDDVWDKICIIDTENASGSLYSERTVGQWKTGLYNTIDIQPPYEASKYIDAIHLAEKYGMEVIIIDSLSHAWSGEGGALDKQNKIAARTGNSYTAWRDVTPEHNKLVDAMLQSTAHVIASIRSKTDYAQVKNEQTGKTVVKNMGLAPVFRDGIEYEFTVCFALDADHIANATKDRTSLFDGKYFMITPESGFELYKWLSGGAPVSNRAQSNMTVVENHAPQMTESENQESNGQITVEDVDRVIKAYCKGMSAEEKKSVARDIKQITGGSANYMGVTEQTILQELYEKYST